MDIMSGLFFMIDGPVGIYFPSANCSDCCEETKEKELSEMSRQELCDRRQRVKKRIDFEMQELKLVKSKSRRALLEKDIEKDKQTILDIDSMIERIISVQLKSDE